MKKRPMSNIALRIASGLVFVAIILGGLLISKYLFAVLFIFLMTAMMLEFYRMTMGKRNLASQILAIATAICGFAVSFALFNWNLSTRFLSLPIMMLMTIPISAVLSKDKGHMEDYAYILTGILYIATPLVFSNTIVFKDTEFNASLLLYFFILIWCSDIGSYCIGVAFGKGKKQMASDISPKKTWVGFFGGLAFCITGAIVMMLSGLFEYPWYHCLALALIMHAACVVGYLFESLWKRRFGIKDSGSIIPGHGGMLDRLDSTLFAIPMGAIYLSIVGLL
jgi:phosphatidate cytidylyltransferase